jgi:hypothetical protein
LDIDKTYDEKRDKNKTKMKINGHGMSIKEIKLIGQNSK